MGAGGRDNGGYPSYYDATAGYYDDTGQDLRVSVTDLQSYATNVGLEMQNFLQNWMAAVVPVLPQTSATAFGLNGEFMEARWARVHHSGATDALTQFFADTIKGLTALSVASMTIAVEYMTGDAEGTDGMRLVFDTFHPDSNATDTLATDWEQLAAEGDQPADPADGETPTTDEELQAQYPEYQEAVEQAESGTTEPSDEDGPVTYGDGRAAMVVQADPYTEVPEIEARD